MWRSSLELHRALDLYSEQIRLREAEKRIERLGRPYKLELAQLDATYKWALQVDISKLRDAIEVPSMVPLLAIGSGGSLSTACLIADLERVIRGCFSSFETPLLASGRQEFLAGTRILIVSARGHNPDVLGFTKLVISAEPDGICSLCCTEDSPLTELVRSFHRGEGFEFDSPAGKDGYLATNSLVALNTLISRAYGADTFFPQNWSDFFDTGNLRRSLSSAQGAVDLIRPDKILLLFGPDTRPAAVDFESKFHESGLASVQVTDYRNFAHGRHLWLAQHPDTTVIAFVSPSDQVVAEATLSLLPKTIKTLKLETAFRGIAAAFAMQAAVFELVAAYGEERGRDPGRPTVPTFGRKLYHLNLFPKRSSSSRAAPIIRKSRARRLAGLPDLTDEEWQIAHENAIAEVTALRFTQCVLDYDGTICDHKDRFNGVSAEVAQPLIEVLQGGFAVGIATGRGKSVREALQTALPKHLWPLVTVAFYNGAIVSSLSDPNSPKSSELPTGALKDVVCLIRDAAIPGVRITERSCQITLEWVLGGPAEPLWHIASSMLAKSGINTVRVVASSRSVDIIEAATSKLNILSQMPGLGAARSTTLFIGDRPSWPGNDFELLSQTGSLSVDDVEYDLNSGWNLAPAGITGSAALVHYLTQIRRSNRYFRLALRRS